MCSPLDSVELMEFGAVVGGDGSHGSWLVSDEPYHPAVDFCSGSGVEFAEQEEAGPAFYHAKDTGSTGTEDGVGFPVSHPGAVVGLCGSLGDGPLAGRTARESYEQDRANLPDRKEFIAAVNRKESELRAVARSRSELESSRRRAIEQVLLRYGLMRQWCDVSHNLCAEMVTN